MACCMMTPTIYLDQCEGYKKGGCGIYLSLNFPDKINEIYLPITYFKLQTFLPQTNELPEGDILLLRES